ncbi:cytochrome P450 [Lentinula aciculospora]|uniref:Cytochrome P450 n=1 Tax=Lentinula aciculospora TaxID=153920 RepID=A0A9W9A5F8_9AGAR|nr:cytochrome P450 [Lentinula aciculospora]
MPILSNSQYFSLAAIALSVILLKRCLSRKKSIGIMNVPSPKSFSWVAGNFRQVFNPAAWGFHEFLAREYGSVVRIHGPFGTNHIYTFDPEAMYHVLLKEANVFEESDGFIEGNRLIFGGGLLGSLGYDHRRQRKMLNPVFSVAHMRDMTPTFFEVTHKLENALGKQLQNGSRTQQIDILSWMGRTALEIIGQAGLGYSFDPLSDEESAHPYSQMIKELFPALMRVQFWRINILPRVVWIGTPHFRRFVVNILPWKDLHHIRDMVDYMWDVAEGIYENKKHAFDKGDELVAQQIGRGKDIISLLMRENMKALNEDKLRDTEVISQMNTFIFAAMDTTSSAMARLLDLLSRHPDVQEKLRQEINEAKHQNGGQDLSYDELNALAYLDAVCRETFRLFPPVSTNVRVAHRDAVVPLQKPVIGLDGTEMHEVIVPKGTTVLMSIVNANRNPELWGKDAKEWKPERWLSPLPDALVNARIPGIYSHLMTFIGGGRSCIGFKFSELEMKVVISTLVEKFIFSPSIEESEISWQMNIVAAPFIGRDEHPQLPINISLVN